MRLIVVTAVEAEARAIAEAAIEGATIIAGGIGRTNAAAATTEAILKHWKGGGMDAVAVGRWLLQIELDDANSRAIFTINNGTPVVIQSNLPASATDLGFEINIWTVENLAKNIKISRYFCEYD